MCISLVLSACGIQGDQPTTQMTIPTTVSTPTFEFDNLVFQKLTIDLIEAPNGMGADYVTTKDMELTQYQGVTYAFESSFSLADRQKCIQTTAMIVNKTGANQNLQINIYSSGSYGYTIVDTGLVHTHAQDWTDVDYTATVLYGIFGEYCNYGMIYGYANYLVTEIYGTSSNVLSENWDYSGNPEALDLNLLCFRNAFMDADSIASIQLISSTFVADYIRVNGESAFQELLRNSGDIDHVDTFVQTLSAYYAGKGIEYTPTNILYRLGGKGYDYIVKSHYAVMYIEKDWFDANKDLCPFTYDNFLHENYGDTKRFFTIHIAQMKQYQDLFALDHYNHDLKIYFTNHSDGNYSHYNGERHAIALYNTGSLMHEYIHALTLLTALPEAWARDGFARYYSFRYDYYGNAMRSADYNSAPDVPKFHWVYVYKQAVGGEIDGEYDFVELQHIATYANGYTNPNDGGGYTTGASFVAYLISRLGEEKVIEIICKTHDFGEYSYEELVADWNCYLADNYAMYNSENR